MTGQKLFFVVNRTIREDYGLKVKGALLMPQQMLTPGEVAKLFRVDPKTVSRWSAKGKLHCIKTIGGHRRYLAIEVEQLLAEARQY